MGGPVATHHPAPYWLLALAGLAVLALVAPRTIRSVRRRQRWRRAAGDRGRAEAAWAELQDDLTDYRVAWSPSASPRALARQVTAGQPMAPAPARGPHPDRPGRPSGPGMPGTRPTRQACGPTPISSGGRSPGTPPGGCAGAPACCRRPRSPGAHRLQHAMDIFGWMDIAAHRLSRLVRRAGGQPEKAQA